MKKSIAYLISALLMVLAFLAPSICAASPSVSVEVSPESGSIADDYDLSVRISGTQQADYPVLSGSDDFKVTLIGPETSVQIVNGKVDASVTYRYSLRPRKEGLLKTPGAEVEIEGQKYSAPGAVVVVSKEAASHNAQPNPNENRSVFLQQSVDEKSVYVGEQIVHSLSLYSSVNVQGAQLSDDPFEGFWNEDIGQQQRSSKEVNGKRYTVVTLKKALFPLKSGEILIAPRVVNAKVPDNSPPRQHSSRSPFGIDPFNDDFFQSFFGGRLKDVQIESNELKINVKELPPLPQDFSNWGMTQPVVGDTNISVNYSNSSIKLGESKTLEIVVSSRGNLKPLTKVPLNIDDNIKTYEESPNSSQLEQNGSLVSYKKLKISLVPQRGGTVTIPSIELGYFDPFDGKYKSARTDQIQFEVEATGRETRSEALNGGSTTKIPPEEPSGEITEQPSIPQPTFREETFLERLSNQISLSLALLLIFILTAVTLLIVLIYRSIVSKKPLKELKQQLSDAGNLDELRAVFRRYIAIVFHINSNPMNSEQLRAEIKKHILDSGAQLAAITLVDELDILQYSGKQVSSEDLSRLRSHLEQMVNA